MIWLQVCSTPILNVTVWSCYHCCHAFWLPLTVANRLKIVWLMEECQPVAHKCYHKKYPHYVCPYLFMMNMFRHCRKPLVTIGHKFRNNRWCVPSFLNLSFRHLPIHKEYLCTCMSTKAGKMLLGKNTLDTFKEYSINEVFANLQSARRNAWHSYENWTIQLFFGPFYILLW